MEKCCHATSRPLSGVSSIQMTNAEKTGDLTHQITGNGSMNTTSVSIFGLGYVGAVTAACLAERGFRIVGVDVNRSKVEMINAGKTPIVEETIGDIIRETVATKQLTACDDVAQASLRRTRLCVCVGTPSPT